MRSHFAIYFLMILFIAATFTTSFAQLPWTKDANNPVLSGGASGTWNRHAMMPCVLFNADSARFEMWYAGSYGSPNWRPYQIGFAVSDDGINWNRLDTPVLTATPGTWDESTVEWPRVIRENGLYKMWYTGWSEDSLGIGYATSTNGVNWIKDTLNNPVLSGPSDWATGGCWYCSVFPVAEGYEMWYTGSDYEYSEANIGRATSIDGINWQKDTLNNPVLTAGDAGRWDSENAYVPSVNYIEGKYYMWYNSKKTNPRIRQVGFAHSIDGINWTKYNNPATESTLYIDSDPVLVPTAGQWDGTYVEHGSVLLIENTLHMWYTGSLYPDGTNLWRIGHATAPVVKNVPGDFATIQAAIDAAHDGNVVLVDEGTYYENINFKGKAITVASQFYMDGDTSHISKTIIDGSEPSNPDSGSVVFFVSGEDTTSVLIGFTIKGGTGTKSKIEDLELESAGGVFLDFSGGKVIHNKIINNTINQNDMYCYSGGIEVFTKSGVTCIIRENEIAYNSVYADWGGGGGVGLGGGDHVVFERNYVHHNLYSSLRHGHGGGVVILGGASGYMGQIELLHNVITDNTILSQANYKYGGGIYSETPNLLMVGNIIAKNKAYYGGGFCTLTLSSL